MSERKLTELGICESVFDEIGHIINVINSLDDKSIEVIERYTQHTYTKRNEILEFVHRSISHVYKKGCNRNPDGSILIKSPFRASEELLEGWNIHTSLVIMGAMLTKLKIKYVFVVAAYNHSNHYSDAFIRVPRKTLPLKYGYDSLHLEMPFNKEPMTTKTQTIDLDATPFGVIWNERYK
jgi:hypothetical protein